MYFEYQLTQFTLICMSYAALSISHVQIETKETNIKKILVCIREHIVKHFT
jgi:hypothetical protein